MTTTPARRAPAALPGHPRLNGARPAHRDGNVLRWLTAYVASAVGDNVYYVALSWAAVRAGTPEQAGLVLALGAVPRAVLLLGGGVVADRFGPRRVVIGSDAARCAAALTIALLLGLARPGVWPLACFALVFGTVDALFLPAVGALPARVTGRDQLARVQGMRGMAVRAANVLGAPLGGLGVALGGPAAAFGTASALFAVSLPLLVRVRLQAPQAPAEVPSGEGAGRAGRSPGSAVGELRDGLRYTARHRVLGPLIVVIALSELGFVGPLNVGLTILAGTRGWGAAGAGWVLAGFGAGAAASSLLLTVRGRLPRAGLVLCCCVVVGALAIGALAFVPAVGWAAADGILIGLLIGLGGALCAALVQGAAEPAYLGRVTAVTGLFSIGIAPLTYPLSGAAIGLWGPGPVFAGSAAVCAAGGLCGLVSGPLRRAELLP